MKIIIYKILVTKTQWNCQTEMWQTDNYLRSEYEYQGSEYEYEYLKIVLEYNSSMSTTTKYYISAVKTYEIAYNIIIITHNSREWLCLFSIAAF